MWYLQKFVWVAQYTWLSGVIIQLGFSFPLKTKSDQFLLIDQEKN